MTLLLLAMMCLRFAKVHCLIVLESGIYKINIQIRYVYFLQMQFFVVIAQNAYAIYTDCDYDKRVEWACVIYLSSLFILFMNFFIHSYVKRPIHCHRKDSADKGQDTYSRTVVANGSTGHHSIPLLNAKKDN